MRKFILSAIVIISFSSYALYLHARDDDQAHVIAPSSIGKSRVTTPSAMPVIPTTAVTQVSTTSQIATPTPTTKQSSLYKDGSFTGSPADAFYGNIQVQVTIANGKITDVKFLQAPNDRDTSIQINQQADPMLAQEAIQAQSATVDIVSGATDTSQAFIQSMQSALSQAKS